MADIGAARVFDENFDRGPGGVIRNMGGFINSVSQELLTRRGGSTITAWMKMISGMVEPIVLIDLDVDDDGVDYLRRLESGPVQAFQFIAPPQDDYDILFDISSTYAPFELNMHIVLVEGVAPTFIHYKNHDGRFTAVGSAQDGLTGSCRMRPGCGLSSDPHAPSTETIRGAPASAAVADLSRPGRKRGGMTPSLVGAGVVRSCIRRKPQ